MEARELYRAGRLTDAIAAMNDEVRKHPADAQRRSFLAELSCLAGRLDKADTQLDVLADRNPEGAPAVALVRQLIRAEQARRQIWADGRVPEFLHQPDAVTSLRLRALTEMRAGHAAASAELVAEADELRPPLRGQCDGVAFEEFRDLDDFTADAFEVLTSTGKCYWVPYSSVISVEFRAPERPCDLLWRRAAMSVRDGPEGEVYLPAVYAGPDGTGDDAACLARTTEWIGEDGEPVRGVGQRTFLVGDDARPMLEMGELSFGGSDG